MPPAKSSSSPATATKPVYALIGDDTFSQLQKLQHILGVIPRDAQRVDVDGERAELSEVLDELRSFAMFGGSKLVVIRSADAFISRFREQLEDYLNNPSTISTLVLRVNTLPANQRIYKLIQKVGVIEKCAAPSERDLPTWIIQHARSAHELTVSMDVARLLADRIGCDLGRLDNELAKLALMSDSGKVDASDVATSVAFQREQEMWDMTNALAAGNVREALEKWRKLIALDPSAEFRAVTWLGMWLEDVRVALAGRQGTVAWKYRDRLPLLVKTAQQLGRDGVADAIDRLAEVDRRSKSGVGDASGNVERFILSFAT
jgi:DNA polymerase III delta subunit